MAAPLMMVVVLVPPCRSRVEYYTRQTPSTKWWRAGPAPDLAGLSPDRAEYRRGQVVSALGARPLSDRPASHGGGASWNGVRVRWTVHVPQ